MNLDVLYATKVKEMTQNFTEAARWYRKAVDQGNADAQFGLGNLSHKGQGAKQGFSGLQIKGRWKHSTTSATFTQMAKA